MCRLCYNLYVKEYRERKRASQSQPANRNRQPDQRPAVDDIPDAVRVRIAQDGAGWAVAVRQGQRWARVFSSPDREEALLVMGGVFGQDIR